MFRLVSNIIASFVRHASIAQRLDDAVSFADSQCELVANLQSELCCVYRRAEELLADVRVNQLQVEELLDYCDVIKDDNAALRATLTEMRAERDALRAAATNQRAAGYDSDPYDGLSPADR